MIDKRFYYLNQVKLTKRKNKRKNTVFQFFWLFQKNTQYQNLEFPLHFRSQAFRTFYDEKQRMHRKELF